MKGSVSKAKARGVQILVAITLALAVLLFASVPALAAGGPEAPITEACSGPVKAGGGRELCGTLNPHSSARVGYYFAYNSGTNCTGGSRTAAGKEAEGQDIEVSIELEGLQSGTEYTYCLVATNSSGETFGQSLTFTTPPTTQEPRTEAATSVMSTSAILEGTLEPTNTKLKYDFEYNAGSGCEGGSTTPEAEAENRVATEVEGLRSNTEYTFCVIAKSTEGGTAVGQPEHFKTLESQAEKEAWFKTFAEENAMRVAEEAAARTRHEEEAATAATKKHQEEEAAASHKREEEVQARNKKAHETPDTGGIALAGTSVTVQPNGAGLVKLECLGIAVCRGKLRLTAKIAARAKGANGKSKARAVSIGSASFSIAGDETKTVKLDLNAAGRALLGADHGRLNASLQILELAPGAGNTQVKAVRLVKEKAHGKP
jgi:hypothetical protein